MHGMPIGRLMEQLARTPDGLVHSVGYTYAKGRVTQRLWCGGTAADWDLLEPRGNAVTCLSCVAERSP